MSLVSSSTPASIDIAIIGAGPQALTLITHLLHKRPDLRSSFWVFDATGTWMAQWQQQQAAIEAPYLRSPLTHHPDLNSEALRRFAEVRPNEVLTTAQLPSTQLFADFCQTLVERWQLQERIVKANVVSVEPFTYHRQPYFRLRCHDGRSLIARRVVVASDDGTPQLPRWVNQVPLPYPTDRLCHSQTLDLQSLDLSGERVLIVGGGLTSAHLAMGAIARGAQVSLLSRRRLCEKWFDTDSVCPGVKKLKDFGSERDWETRWELIHHARNGGSITPDMMTQLQQVQQTGRLTLHERCQVLKAKWQGHWQVSCEDGSLQECDRIWLATGTRLDLTLNPLLADVLQTYPLPIVNGLPVLDAQLRWHGCELFLMGGWASLQIGPTAASLAGARLSSERLIPALSKTQVNAASASFLYPAYA